MIDSSKFKTTTLLVQSGNAVTNYRNVKMEDIDLTSVQSDAIIALLRRQSITATELKEHLRLSQSTTAGIISRLETKGLICRAIDKDDARKALLRTTEEGKKLEEPLKEIALDVQTCLTDGMSESEVCEFDRLLQKALDNLNQIRTGKN